MNTRNLRLIRGDIDALTSCQAGKMRGMEFAGFLVREDEDAIYVADPQGTWVIPRDSLVKVGIWDGFHCVPEDMRAAGNPVRVTLKEGATFYEIRPWRVSSSAISNSGSATRDAVRQIFSLGDGKLPVTEGGCLGEKQLGDLERRFFRRLGFHPDVCSDPAAYSHGGSAGAAGTSATGDQDSSGGSTGHDTDSDF